MVITFVMTTILYTLLYKEDRGPYLGIIAIGQLITTFFIWIVEFPDGQVSRSSDKHMIKLAKQLKRAVLVVDEPNTEYVINHEGDVVLYEMEPDDIIL